MDTITVDIKVPEDLREAFDAKVAGCGGSRSEYVSQLIVESLSSRLSERSAELDQILMPFRTGFAESGFSESQLRELLDRELEDVRANRQSLGISDGK